MLFDKLKIIFDEALETIETVAPSTDTEPDYFTIFKVNKIVQELINCGNTDLSLKLFSAIHWKFTFKALEFSEQNYDRITHKKQHHYLNFLEKDTKMHVVDSNCVIDGFYMLVNLRFRVQFYMEFINAATGEVNADQIGAENMFNHFQMVTTPLKTSFFLTFFLDDVNFERALTRFPDDRRFLGEEYLSRKSRS